MGSYYQVFYQQKSAKVTILCLTEEFALKMLKLSNICMRKPLAGIFVNSCLQSFLENTPNETVGSRSQEKTTFVNVCNLSTFVMRHVACKFVKSTLLWSYVHVLFKKTLKTALRRKMFSTNVIFIERLLSRLHTCASLLLLFKVNVCNFQVSQDNTNSIQRCF